MRLRRLRQIKGFRIFSNWRDEEKERPHQFGKVTAVFGANGTGKSTLADVFQELQNAQRGTGTGEALNGIELELSDAEKSIKVDGTDSKIPRLHVFGRKYIDDNLRTVFDDGSRGTPLYVIGEKDADLEERISELSRTVEISREVLSYAQRERATAQRKVDATLDQMKVDTCSDLGKFDSNVYNTNTFNKAKARKAIEQSSASTLVPQELDTSRQTLSYSIESIPRDVDVPELPDSTAIESVLREIGELDISFEALAQFEENQALADWAQQGIPLHREGDDCGFCGNQVTADRLEALAAHFDDSYLKLDQLLDRAADQVREFKDAWKVLESAFAPSESWNPELRAKFDQLRSSQNLAKEKVEERISDYQEFLSDRKSERSKKVAWSKSSELDLSSWVEGIDAMNDLNSGLKSMRSSLEAEKKEAAKKLLEHWAASHKAELAEGDRKLLLRKTALGIAEESVERAQERIIELKNKRDSSGDGDKLAALITQDLAAYLGHGQLTVGFVRDKDLAGLEFRRNGVPATNLSEGERNAVALLHFLRSLESMGVLEDLDSTLVVIDDPVSSMDQDAILSAFSFIKERTSQKGQSLVGQLIVFTHNYDFFRLWRQETFSGRSKDRYEMNQSGTELLERRASLLEMHVRLELAGSEIWRKPVIREVGPKFDQTPSDYYSLFEKACASTQPENEDLLVLTGNGTRRLLESFLRFKAPHSDDFTGAATNLGRSKRVEPEITTRVVKALHRQSHMQDPDIHSQQHVSDVVQDIRMALRFMEAVDKDHFDGMIKATQAAPDFAGV